MLDHYTQYVGSSPFASPAVLTSIAHMQSSGGVWYPMGGTRAVAEGLVAFGERHGAQYRPNTEITGLDIESGSLRAVVTTSGERIPVSAAVSNMDAIRTYAELVGGDAAKRYAKASAGKGGGTVYGQRGFEPACSGVVLYLGLSKSYDHLAHHDFVFSATPRRSSTTSTTSARSPPTRRPISPRPPPPTRRSPRRAARRSTSSSTRRTCARITTGRPCSRPTAGASSTS